MVWYGKYMGYFRKGSTEGVSGELLVADFQSALVNLVTMDVATQEAERSEANVTNALQYSGAGNGVFTTPGDISPVAAQSIAKSSVDAHLKKVQAAQITNFTAAQVTQMQAEGLKKYQGRKVRIARVGDSKDVFIPLWADKYSGQMRQGTYNGKVVTGTIQDLSFEKNVIVVKPTLVAQAFAPGRKFFMVQVINMKTLAPDVTIQLL